MSESPLVEAKGLVKSFAAHGGLLGAGPRFRAVDGVDLVVRERETVGLVGESGSGKSTLGRLIVRLVEPDAGSIRFGGADLLAVKAAQLRRLRRQFQIVFQDPHASLNPRMRVGTLVREPLDIHRIGDTKNERREAAARLLEEVGLDRAAMDRFPHEFSGGQRQRIGIARAMACGPRFVVADEPVASLDASIQAQILNLLVDLRERHGLALLFIAHDLRIVRFVAARVAVMYLGRIVEDGPTAEVYASPLHPYTRALLDAIPRRRPGDPPARVLAGEPPSPVNPPSGCRFRTRCPLAEAVCAKEDPPLREIVPGRRAACHLV
ncbi:MAG TPA: ABC transporter ATP-binding protein [Candidatus Polarisedimenticolaceae bacterium]|nr:ABC transporter ATP-binding protein [Candidatus Polarisedimenticolaceae bacterium]